MKITDINVRLVSCPLPEEMEWANAYGKSSTRTEVLVFVKTDEGLTGIGEAYHAVNGPRAIEALIISHLKPLVLGRDPLDVEDLWHTMFFSTVQLGSAAVAAISGIDIALWDLFGKAVEQPVYRLLGGGGRERLPAYVGCKTLGIQPVETLVPEALTYVDAGYRALKLRGGAGVREDTERVAAVREAVGDDVDVMIDANSAYSFPEALRLANALQPYDTYWLEDPFDFTVAYHHQEMGRLRERSPVPIASGGNLYTRFQIRDLIQRGGVDYLTPDVVKCGGISEMIKIAHVASAFGLLFAPHTIAGLGQVATLHVAAAVPGHVMTYVEWDPSTPNPPRDEILTTPIVVRDGHLHLPTDAGLGTAIDMDALDAYPYLDGADTATAARTRRPAAGGRRSRGPQGSGAGTVA